MHDSGHASPIDMPFWGRFHYSRAEVIADGVVHAVGIVLAIAAGSALLSLSAFHAGPGEYVAAIFYVVSLLAVLSISLRLQSLAADAGEMDPAPLRPRRDLSADRSDLHAVPCPARRCAR